MPHSLNSPKINTPWLFVQAQKDPVLTPEFSVGMERYVSNLTKDSVDAAHFLHLEAPEQVNNILQKWLNANGV